MALVKGKLLRRPCVEEALYEKDDALLLLQVEVDVVLGP